MRHAIDLPRHYYGYVDRSVIGIHEGWEPAILFGLTSEAGRALGLTVLLECGAMYRQLPPHAWAFSSDPPESEWRTADAQKWDCLGRDAVAVEYRYLHEAAVLTRDGLQGSYLFSVEFYGDGFSLEPGQSKALHAIWLTNDRLTFQPGDRLLWTEASFTRHNDTFPTWIKRADTIWTAE